MGWISVAEAAESHPNCIGVDIIAGDAVGGVGGAAGTVAQANVCASGDNLPMFAENEMDFIVARHVLEHFTDPVKALLEWKRVLKRGGVMVLVVPDDRALNTLSLDPSHKHAFTPEGLRNLLGTVEGFQVERLEDDHPELVLLVRRAEGIGAYGVESDRLHLERSLDHRRVLHPPGTPERRASSDRRLSVGRAGG